MHPIEVAIDGAQVRTAGTIHFDLVAFLKRLGWNAIAESTKWQCDWTAPEDRVIRIHSSPGRGDLVAKLADGRTLRVECKKGPLARSKSSVEYPLLREAFGQLVTISEVSDGDVLAVAVPHSPKFHELADRWREAPLIKRFGFQILTVARTGDVWGLDNSQPPTSMVEPPSHLPMKARYKPIH